MIKRFGGWLFLAAAVFAADLITKQWAVATLLGKTPIVVTPFLRFVYAENTGIAFGLLANGGLTVKIGLLAITTIVTIIFIVLLWRSQSRLFSLAVALMLGGAVGNLVDRFALGYVVDFIDAHWGQYHWPTFNIADMAINLGAAFYIVFLFFGDDKKS